MNFSLLVPTRGRPDLLRSLLQSIEESAEDPGQVEIVLNQDDDDATRTEPLPTGLSVIRCSGPPGRPMGLLFRQCYEASRGRYLMLLNDDVRFRTKGWDRRVLSAFQAFKDDLALVYGDDLDQGERVPSFPILSRRTCQITGQICPAGYLNLHLESHLSDVFREVQKLGHSRVVYLKDVVFEHLHSALGKSASDATSTKRDPAHDERLFLSLAEERRHHAFLLASEIGRGPQRRSSPRSGTASRVAVILPADRGLSEFLGPSLHSLLSGDGAPTGVETIIVGEARLRDRGLSAGLERQAGIRWVDGTGGGSYFAACNAAAKESEAPYLAFLRPGYVPAAGWISTLTRELESAPDIGVAGSRIANPRNGRIHHAGISFRIDSGKVFATHLHRGRPLDYPPANQSRRCQAVSTSAMMVRAGDFAKQGGFREDLGALAGLDFCLRMNEQGRSVRYVPDALVWQRDALDLHEAIGDLEGRPGSEVLRGRVREELPPSEEAAPAGAGAN